MLKFKISTIDKGASTEITREKYSLDQQGITNWLKKKNIISDNDIVLSFHDLLPWERRGGETYSTSFEFSTNNQNKKIFIKALVTTSPEKSLKDWYRRREILLENGIPVSNWYFNGEGIIIEDFYPSTFQSVAFDRILKIGLILDHLGFVTLKFTDDIRADMNGNPYFVDFGFDLGEPSDNISLKAKELLLSQYSEKENEINKFYE
jgi:hypothetical protein